MMIKKHTQCEINNALSMISGKWKPALLLTLINEGPKRFNELARILNGITPKMLTSQLKELEQENLITRIQYDVIPPKVVYEMTAYGMELKTVLNALHKWGMSHQLHKI